MNLQRERDLEWAPEELMAIAASRLLRDGQTCFVGIGLPSAAAILAQHTHAPRLVLIYESGALGSRPRRLPLSVADDDLAATARSVVSVPEMFNYWLQPGRIELGILGAAQVDRFANLNSTVIGRDYARPQLRLPGSGGAPEIMAACRDIIIIIRQSLRTFVERVDFITSLGHGAGQSERVALGFPGRGPIAVVTDIGIYEPDPQTKELTLTQLQPGGTIEKAREETGWELAIAAQVRSLEPPRVDELRILRALNVGKAGRVG